MRLNVGCGTLHLKGYVNIDIRKECQPDQVADIRKLPYEDNSVDEIIALHVLETFPLWEAQNVLKEWHRVLRPGGAVDIELPSLNKVLFFLQQKEMVLSHTLETLYGDPSSGDLLSVNKWCYSTNHLEAWLKEIYREVKEAFPRIHIPEVNMRWLGVK